MDAQLRAEAQALGAQSIDADAFGVINGGRDSIHRRLETGNPRNQNELRTKIEQLLFFALDSDVELKIDGAEDEAPHLGTGTLRERVRIPKTACRLDEGQNWRRCARMIGESADVFDSFRFRQKHAGHAWFVADSEIVTKPLALRAIHADVHGMFGRKPCG